MTLDVELSHAFPGFTLDVSFEAPEGVTALFGPSGTGKTSVVNAVAGLLHPDRGRIRLGDRVLLDTAAGVSLPVHARRVGYVFQDGRLFPHMSVARNLTYGAAGESADAVERVADLLDITALLDRAPGALSGGEQQRVAIGRALLSRPDILLMDEPLASLDAARKAAILPYLERLRDEAGVPILYVSHAIEEVARLANTIVLLDAGRVRTAGPAAEVLADPTVVRLLGLRDAGSLLTARVVAHHPDGISELETSGARLLLPQVPASVGARLRVRIAAQDIIIARTRPEDISALNILDATVEAVRPGEGPGAIVQLRSGGDLLLARITRRSAKTLALAPGQGVFAIVKSVSVSPVDIGAGMTRMT